jgi:hypothetical protein
MKIVNIDVNGELKIVDVYDTESKISTSVTSSMKIPSGNANNIILNFNFMSPNANQSGLHLFAIFTADFLENQIEVEIDKLTVGNTTYNKACYVPHEVLDKTGKITIGIYGFILNSANEVKKRLSLEPISQSVVIGSYDKRSLLNLLPTANVFEVYFDKVKRAEIQRQEDLEQIDEKIELLESNLEKQITQMSDGSAIPVNSTSKMTDTSQLYVNTADGYVYYHNGSAWTKGWKYQIAQSDDVVTDLENRIKLLEGKRAIQTVYSNKVITETYDDNSYKTTQLDNSKIYEKWYSSEGTLIFSKTITITANGVTEVIN